MIAFPGYTIHVRRSARRTLSMRFSGPDTLEVSAPLQLSDEQIRDFIASRSRWLKVHNPPREAAENKLTEAEIRVLAERMKQLLPPLLDRRSAQLGVRYGQVTLRLQRTRWGSCSSKGNLNFNALLALAPPEVLDYVVVHELCHRKEMNHSPRFWALVASVLPDYEIPRRWLKKEGTALMARLPS